MRIALYILGSLVGLLIALRALYVYNRNADITQALDDHDRWLQREQEGGGS